MINKFQKLIRLLEYAKDIKVNNYYKNNNILAIVIR
jgi:hypothetical protein